LHDLSVIKEHAGLDNTRRSIIWDFFSNEISPNQIDENSIFDSAQDLPPISRAVLVLCDAMHARGSESLPALVARNVPDAGRHVIANQNLLLTTVRTVHPNPTALAIVVGSCRLDHNVTGNGALGIVAAVRDLILRLHGAFSSSPTQHLSQRAELVGPCPAQLNVSVFLAGNELGLVAEVAADDCHMLDELLRKRGVVFELLTLQPVQHDVIHTRPE
jgi:hypothetical protein